MIFLHELPEEHPDRNRPLLGARYHWRGNKVWREVLHTMKISKVSYNDLAPCWTDNDVFTFGERDAT